MIRSERKLSARVLSLDGLESHINSANRSLVAPLKFQKLVSNLEVNVTSIQGGYISYIPNYFVITVLKMLSKHIYLVKR